MTNTPTEILVIKAALKKLLEDANGTIKSIEDYPGENEYSQELKHAVYIVTKYKESL